MLRYSLVFLLFALVAALLGFTPIAGTAFLAAKVLFLVCLVLFVASLFLSGWRTIDPA